MISGRGFVRCGVGALVLVLASCGVVVDIEGGAGGGTDGGDPDGSATGDGAPTDGIATGDGAPTDAGADAAPCTDDMAFVAVDALPELGMTTSLRFRDDGRIALIASHGLADLEGDQIYEGPFPKGPTPYATVFASPWDDSHPAPSPDGTTLYLETDAGGLRQIAVANRTAPAGPFGAPLFLDLTDAGKQTREPWLLRSGRVLYFTMAPGEMGGRDIYRAERVGTSWSVTLVGGAISTPSQEGHAVVSDDELTIFFARGPSQGEIWVATRASKTDVFQVADPVSGVNVGTADDRPTWLSPDRCTLYFTSDRSGVYGMYRARRR